MTLTLLLDLDDTLLSNDIGVFLPAYLKLLGKHLSNYVTPDKMVKNLLAATQVMVENNAPGLTLESAFDQAFYPAIGHTKDEMRPMLNQFYGEVFPSLKTITAQRPAAIQLVEHAVQRGDTLVVATNPIFPRQAIIHRLDWAGLSPERVPFALITDYERFHFSKPNPAFYAEILAQLGWPNQPAVMVGNSLTDDLIPAACLGLPVFWVVDAPTPLPEGLPPLSESGSLADVPAWLEKVDAAGPQREEPTSPAALLAFLRSTPAALSTICAHLTSRQWQERPEPREWSLTEILCHLRDNDREVYLPRIEKVIAEESPFLPGINTDTWADERNYLSQNGPATLHEYIEIRSSLIDRLASIPASDWQRGARHAIFGPTTLQELVAFMITHDRTHIQQILKTIRALD